MPVPTQAPTQALEEEYGRQLQMVIEGRPVADCLEELTRAAARLHPELRACVLRVASNGGTVADAFGVRVPDSFCFALRGAAVDGAGPRDRARWIELCRAHGIGGWSVAHVEGEGGSLVALVIACFEDAREATASEQRVIRFLARTAGVAIVRDRTASTRIERDEDLRLVLETARDFAVIALDTSGVVTSWNVGAQKMLGYTEDEIVGTMGHIIFTAQDIARGEADFELATALRSGKAENERWHVRKNGTRFWGSGLAVRVDDENGQPRGIVKIMRDRTEARLAEIAIRESEQRFRSLVSVITDVSWSTDAEGCIVRPQHAWEAYTGQSFEEYRGYGWADALHEDDRASIEQGVREACRTRTPHRGTGRLWNAATQSYRWCEARATPILEEDGSVREWVRACTDVQERKEAEQAAMEASRRKDEFLAVLAHELRNPLAPIRHGLELLGTGPAEPAKQNRIVEMMLRQVGHLVRLVDDLLEVSRFTRGRIELRKEVVDVVAVVHNAVETTTPAIEAGEHQLRLELPRERVLVNADPVRLAQVVGNLLGNAAKFTDPAGTITVRVESVGDHAVISVRDTGVGISAEMLPRVFDAFTQIDRTVDRAQGGLGIGLGLVDGLVRLHGGTVEARSEGLGRGSEFVVTLPLVTGLSLASPSRPQPANATDRTPDEYERPIVIIDDNRDAADTLAMLIEQKGRSVHTAYDGSAGLDEIRRQRPVVAFVDLGMPGIDGYAVANEVRSDPQLHDVKLIALTGWGSEADRRRSQMAGFDHHLVKPVDSSTLETVLQAFARG
jgi:PAS domain S-box-containing protein